MLLLFARARESGPPVIAPTPTTKRDLYESLIDKAAERERLEKERAEAALERKSRLRSKSKSIFNALYDR